MLHAVVRRVQSRAVPWGNDLSHTLRRSSLSEEEKAHLRGRLLGLLEQPDQQLAVQVAVVLSKVARYDFPRAWPALFSDLLAQLAGAGQLLQRRVHLALHHVLKELASKRLAADQRNFEQAGGGRWGWGPGRGKERAWSLVGQVKRPSPPPAVPGCPPPAGDCAAAGADVAAVGGRHGGHRCGAAGGAGRAAAGGAAAALHL
jgi:hypothetical protein